MWLAIMDVSGGQETRQVLQSLIQTNRQHFQELTVNPASLVSFFKNGKTTKEQLALSQLGTGNLAVTITSPPHPPNELTASPMEESRPPGPLAMTMSSHRGEPSAPGSKELGSDCADSTAVGPRASTDDPAPNPFLLSEEMEEFGFWGGRDEDGDINMGGAVQATHPAASPSSMTTGPNSMPADNGGVGATEAAATGLVAPGANGSAPHTSLSTEDIPAVAALTNKDLPDDESDSDASEPDPPAVKAQLPARGPLRSSSRQQQAKTKLPASVPVTPAPPAKKRKFQRQSRSAPSASVATARTTKQEELFWESTTHFAKNAVSFRMPSSCLPRPRSDQARYDAGTRHSYNFAAIIGQIQGRQGNFPEPCCSHRQGSRTPVGALKHLLTK